MVRRRSRRPQSVLLDRGQQPRDRRRDAAGVPVSERRHAAVDVEPHPARRDRAWPVWLPARRTDGAGRDARSRRERAHGPRAKTPGAIRRHAGLRARDQPASRGRAPARRAAAWRRVSSALGAPRRGRDRAADRLRQRREPVHGARRRPPARPGRAARDRRGARSTRSASDVRGLGRRGVRRSARRRPRVPHAARIPSCGAGRHPAHRRRAHHRAHLARDAGRGLLRGPRVRRHSRASSVVAGFHAPARRRTRIDEPAPLGARRAHRRPDRARARPAHRVGLAHSQLRRVARASTRATTPTTSSRFRSRQKALACQTGRPLRASISRSWIGFERCPASNRWASSRTCPSTRARPACACSRKAGAAAWRTVRSYR